MYKLILCLLIFIPTGLFAHSSKNDFETFHAIFTHWTLAFNQKNLESTCALFSKSVIANYQGVPQKNYDSICEGFKKVFMDTKKIYHYRFKLHHIYRTNNLAAVRITWILSVYKNHQKIITTTDEGIDVFIKSPSGQWQIVNYLAYPTHDTQHVFD